MSHGHGRRGVSPRARQHGNVKRQVPIETRGLIVKVCVKCQIGNLEALQSRNWYGPAWFDRHADYMVMLVSLIGPNQLKHCNVNSRAHDFPSGFSLEAAPIS